MQKEAKNTLSKLKEKRRTVWKELCRAPKGSLYIVKDHGYTSYRQVYFEKGRKIQIGISKDPELIIALAHKRFLEEKIRRLDINISLAAPFAKGAVSIDDRDILNSLPGSFGLLDDFSIITGNKSPQMDWPDPRPQGFFPREYPLSIDPADRFEWARRPYAENTAFIDSKTHFSARGLRCRSKSEAGILGIYDGFVLPYHTDETIYLNGEMLAPDIIGCRADGVLIFHEHHGVGTEGYARRNERKERIYRAAGIVEGKNLIHTYDKPDGSINLKLVRMIIMDAYDLK